jgi:hypothetical protein
VGWLWLFVGGRTHFVSWWVCSSSFVDFDRGQWWSFVGGHARLSRGGWSSFVGSCHLWVVVVCGWLVQSFVSFENACDSNTLPGKTWEPVSRVRVRLGLQIPNPHLHLPPPVTPTCTGSQTCDIPYFSTEDSSNSQGASILGESCADPCPKLSPNI